MHSQEPPPYLAFRSTEAVWISYPVLRAARDRDIEVHVWTVNRAATMTELIELGVDGIITDDPALAVRLNDELASLSQLSRLMLRFRTVVADTPEREER